MRMGSRRLAEEIHDRRAAERERFRREEQAPLRRAVEEEQQIDRLAGRASREAGDVDEVELLRKREVLLQQPIRRMRMARIGDDLFVILEAHRRERVLRQIRMRLRVVRHDRDADRVAQHQLVHAAHEHGIAVEIEAELVDAEDFERIARATRGADAAPRRRRCRGSRSAPATSISARVTFTGQSVTG